MESSFAKDVLSVVILASWFLPVAYVTVMLVIERIAAVVRFVRGSVQKSDGPGAPGRKSAARVMPELPELRRASVNARGIVASARVVHAAQFVSTPRKPPVNARWKSQDRVAAAAC